MDSSKQLDWLNADADLLAEEVHFLTDWRNRGVLKAIDVQWIEQLASHAGESHAAVLMAGALSSAALGAGHICLDLADVWSQPPEGIRANELQQVLMTSGVHSVEQWCQQLWQSDLVSQAQAITEKPMVLAGTRLYLYRYFQYEQSVLGYINRQISAPTLSFDHALISTLFPADSNELDWQKVAVANAASLPFSVISGGPGTGKTTTVTKLLALLVAESQRQGQRLRIELAAPTGKAAARLTESIAGAKASLPLSDDIKHAIPEQASTLHRLLGSDFGRSRFKHHHDNPLHLDVLLVDEVSMVDLPMMAKLIDALPSHARLILLGDKDQLASVEAGSVLGDLSFGIEQAYFQPNWADHLYACTGEEVTHFANAMAPPISRVLTLLRKSYRFDANSGIGHLAKAMNAGDANQVMVCLDQDYQDVQWHEPDDHQTKPDIGRLAKGYDEYWRAVREGGDVKTVYQAFSQYQILTAVRQGEFGVEHLNAHLEQHFYQRGLLRDPHLWYPGKAIILTRNDAALGLFNGDIGICLADAEQRLRVWFMQPDGEFVGLLPSRLNEYEVVFAMTVHKSQGSEFAEVALVLPMTPSPVLTKELVYTGITRAKRRFTLWGSRSLIRLAAESRIKRHSGLLEALWGNGP
ncbi:exodeoxyribonuclease V subunit alpha [Marinomonas aquiplantarum]|uniref:RecBCD enzyme subunit RecD n=1 Tax=Marinomonas aquiplantarum TaxID=491951 RepID=A0A366CTE7_9GAMM|nr:exodeoxyribonuclease V subunit alpha [Marinomonas aquiplantarum]RBO79570.1 DNA helicase/exodeoxyribonuclease V alpha subunit [Marinomonas aquiplantarum]